MSISDNLIVPVAAGGLAYLGSKFLLGNNGSVVLGGMNLDVNIAEGIVVAASAGVANVSKNFILTKIPNIPVISPKVLQMSVGPVLCGVSNLVANQYLLSSSNENRYSSNTNSPTMVNSFLLGAGSYVAAEYVQNMWKGTSVY